MYKTEDDLRVKKQRGAINLDQIVKISEIQNVEVLDAKRNKGRKTKGAIEKEEPLEVFL